MQTVKINGCKYVRDFRYRNIEFGEQLNFSPRQPWVELQFSGCGNEVLLKNL